jgi:hypothetical protein
LLATLYRQAQYQLYFAGFLIKQGMKAQLGMFWVPGDD